MQITKESVKQMDVSELVQFEEQLLQQLKTPSVRANDESYALVKMQLWIVRDALLDPSEIAAQTY